MSYNKPIRRIAIVGTGVIGEGVSQMAGDRSVEQLAQEEDEVLVGLIKLRAQQGKALEEEKLGILTGIAYIP